MTDEMFTVDMLINKAEEMKKRKFPSGFDKMTPTDAVFWFNVNGKSLIENIQDGKYHPMPEKGFYTAKQNGGYRQQICEQIGERLSNSAVFI